MILSDATVDERVKAGASFKHNKQIEKARAIGTLDGVYNGLGQQALCSGRQGPNPAGHSIWTDASWDTTATTGSHHLTGTTKQ